MEPIYQKTFHVRSYEVDFLGRVRPTSILNYCMESAGDHARMLGVAVKELMPRGLTWVLSRTHLRILGSTHVHDGLVVTTWPSLREGRFTCREFELAKGDGTPFALATCSFAVLDLQTRRPIVIDDRLPHYPLTHRRAIDDQFHTLPRLQEPEKEVSFRVGLGDLDLNGHANNVAYVAWALETVPMDVIEGYELADLEVSYRAEIFHGQTVASRCRRIVTEERPTFLHQLVKKEDGTELTRAVTRWRKYMGKKG